MNKFKNSNKFEIGDKVRMLGYPFTIEVHNKIGTIVKVKSNGDYIVDDIDKFNGIQMFCYRHSAKVELAEIKIANTKTARKIYKGRIKEETEDTLTVEMK